MIKKPGSQQYQGLAMPKKAITPPTPCQVGLSQILCRSLHFYFAINKRYRVYRYEGSLKGLDDAVVLLAWKA
ncbi:hypothetical protein V2J23_17700, partial [Geobacillus thermoleovorans]|uniref:hypothetical protein n=1 Tax=Geobacillus thermoleovorans TaxID=33941 RepID=UPI00345BB8EB